MAPDPWEDYSGPLCDDPAERRREPRVPADFPRTTRREVRALVVHPDGRVDDGRLPDELATWQGLVGGNLEYLPLSRPSWHAYANEDGVFAGLALNEVATRVVWHLRPEFPHALVGPVVFLGSTPGGNEADCPDELFQLIVLVALEWADGRGVDRDGWPAERRP